jgi:hypothetical protein
VKASASIRKILLIAFLTPGFNLQSQAQQRVSVGAVTKYTGGPAALDELKDSELYMSTLESQVATESIKFSNINYLDRSSVGQVFRELNLSSNSAFDGSSGALRGLLGRLDFLIVIDASSPSIARLRAIDTETGAVRSIATCKRSRSLFGSASDGEQDCVRGFVAQLQPSLREVLAIKQRRNADQAAQKQAADAAQQREIRVEAQEQKDAARQHEIDVKTAQAQAEQEQKLALELQSQMAALQPDLEMAVSRLSSANTFWNGMRQQMASRGQALRSEIQTSLNASNSNGLRCRTLFKTSQPVALRACIAELNHHLDQLDEYK